MGAATILVCDETPTGERTNTVRLTLASERITARELIERRVRSEVEIQNRDGGEYYRGLVTPKDAEVALNGARLRKGRQLDADEQCRVACDAFEKNAFFMLAGDRQIEDLDETIVVTPGLEVSFVRLVPLVGG